MSIKYSFLKKNHMVKKVSSLMNIELDSEPVYGDNDKYIVKSITFMCFISQFLFIPLMSKGCLGI